MEGLEVLDKINKVFVNQDHRPLQNIRIKHSVIIDDPFEGEESKFGIAGKIRYPSRSPSPSLYKHETIDLKNIDFKEAAFLEDEDNVDLFAQKKSEKELKQER